MQLVTMPNLASTVGLEFDPSSLRKGTDAGGVGSGRKPSFVKKDTLNDPKLLHIMKKPWGKRTDEEHHYVARHYPRQRSLFSNMYAGSHPHPFVGEHNDKGQGIG